MVRIQDIRKTCLMNLADSSSHLYLEAVTQVHNFFQYQEESQGYITYGSLMHIWDIQRLEPRQNSGRWAQGERSMTMAVQHGEARLNCWGEILSSCFRGERTCVEDSNNQI